MLILGSYFLSFLFLLYIITADFKVDPAPGWSHTFNPQPTIPLEPNRQFQSLVEAEKNAANTTRHSLCAYLGGAGMSGTIVKLAAAP